MSALISPSAPARPCAPVELGAPTPMAALRTDAEPVAAESADSLPARTLKVGGIVGFSAQDYPGKFSLVVFVQGCPWRCGYCHNPHLQSRAPADSAVLPWAAVLQKLQRRVGLLDAVVFSGGEPTMDPALAPAMRDVRALGFGVGLHTAGIYPRRLEQVLHLVDWVGLDIKAGPASYDGITGIADSARSAFASADLVLGSGVANEVRTTVHPSLHSEKEILDLAQALQAMGVRHYALQLFRATGCIDTALHAPAAARYPGAELLARLSGIFERFTFRRD